MLMNNSRSKYDNVKGTFQRGKDLAIIDDKVEVNMLGRIKMRDTLKNIPWERGSTIEVTINIKCMRGRINKEKVGPFIFDFVALQDTKIGGVRWHYLPLLVGI